MQTLEEASLGVSGDKLEQGSANLEKNFLKLKELYDTLYKANVALMKDQRDLEEKYSKLLKAYNKDQQKSTMAKHQKGSARQPATKPGNDGSRAGSAQKARQNSLSRARSISKNDSSFGSGTDLPYNGLGNS